MVATRLFTLSALASIIYTTAALEKRQDDDQTTVSGSTVSSFAIPTVTATNALPTAVTNCHTHDDTPYCVADGADWEIETDVDETNLPDGYEDCQPNGDDGDEITCAAADGAQVVLHREGNDHTDGDDASNSMSTTGTASAPAATTGPTAGGATPAASSQASESAAAAAEQTGAASAVGASPVSLLGLIVAIFAL